MYINIQIQLSYKENEMFNDSLTLWDTFLSKHINVPCIESIVWQIHTVYNNCNKTINM